MQQHVEVFQILLCSIQVSDTFCSLQLVMKYQNFGKYHETQVCIFQGTYVMGSGSAPLVKMKALSHVKLTTVWACFIV